MQQPTFAFAHELPPSLEMKTSPFFREAVVCAVLHAPSVLPDMAASATEPFPDMATCHGPL